MKKILLAAFVAFSVTSFVPAFSACQLPANTMQENDEIDALVEKLLIQTKIFDQMDNMMNAGLAPYMQEMNNLPAEQVAVIKRFITRSRDYMKSADFIQAFKSIYKKHFTVCEVQALVEFYESAAGSKFITMAPQVMNEAISLITPVMQNMTNDMVLELQELQTKQAPMEAQEEVAVIS